ELGRGRAGEGATRDRALGSEGPDAVRLIGDEGHAESCREHFDVECVVRGRNVVGQRHADVGLARAFGLDLPTRARRERVAVDGELVEDRGVRLQAGSTPSDGTEYGGGATGGWVGSWSANASTITNGPRGTSGARQNRLTGPSATLLLSRRRATPSTHRYG